MKKFMIAAFAVALVVAFAAPSFAFDVSFGGRVRTDFGYTHQSEELTEGSDSATRGFFNVNGASYFRSTFTSKDKKVGARIEMGMGKSSVGRRTVFGWYTIGNCKLVAGNNYTWAGDGVIGHSSWLTDLTGDGSGLTYFGRMAMIALEWRSGNFGVQVGIFAPNDTEVEGSQDFGWYLPQLHVTGDLKFAMFQLAPAIAVANYQWESSIEGGDDSYTAYFVGLPVRGTFGPVTVTANLYYAVNGGNDFGGSDLARPVVSPDGSIENSTQYGGLLEVAYKAGPMTLAGGFGASRVSNDEWKQSGGDATSASSGWKDDSTTQMRAYVTMDYKLHANLSLKPEIGYIAYGDSPETGEDAGDELKFGLRFQFVF